MERTATQLSDLPLGNFPARVDEWGRRQLLGLPGWHVQSSWLGQSAGLRAVRYWHNGRGPGPGHTVC